MFNIPTIIKENSSGYIRATLLEEMLSDRELLLHGEINTDTAQEMILQLKYLAKLSSEPICIYISSPGGELSAGFALYDEMKSLQNQGITLKTFCQGTCASFAAIILSAGSKGHRYIYPHSRVMIHDPLISSCVGSALQIEEISKELLQNRKHIAEILADHTDHSSKEILELTKHDKWFSAKEAATFGLVDHIIE